MTLAEKITNIINRFYVRPLRKIIPHQTFLYAACGGGNMFFNWVLYGIIYNFIIQEQAIHIGSVSMSAHDSTYWIVVPIIFYTGFWLNKHIAFAESKLRTRTQLVRYFISVLGVMILSNLGLKFFVEYVGIYPTPSYIITS